MSPVGPTATKPANLNCTGGNIYIGPFKKASLTQKGVPNYGEDYQKGFAEVFSRLQEKYQLVYLPFLLEGVAGVRKYTRPDGIHPLGEGYKLVAKLVWQHLQPMLEENPQ